MIKTIAYIGVALALLAIVGCGDSTPVAPTGLVITSTSPITLSWNVVLAATSYNIYRGSVSGGLSSKTLLATNAPAGNQSPSTTFTDTTVTTGVTYYYQVTAVNWDKESAPSNEVSVTP
jgi:fibronectin type 3 domain-containing protein